MKRLFLALAVAVCLSSCGFNGNRQGSEEMPSISQDTPKAATHMEEAKEVLKDLLESIAENLPEEMALNADPEDLPGKPDTPPAEEVKWYDKDYSITVEDLDGGGTYIFTRIGKKMYFRSKAGKDVRMEEFDILDNGTLSAKVTKNGQYVRSYTMDLTPADALKLYLGSDKVSMRVIGSSPRPVAGSKSGTRCGRPCWVVSKIQEEALLGYSTRTEDVYYVDKEYGFIYEKVSSASGNVGVSYKGISHFRVTAFTDSPTQKNING